MAEEVKTRETEQKKDEQEEKQRLLGLSEVSIILDTYDDIFSDFDPRPFSQRSLSDDFLREAGKASKDKNPDKLELRLLLPSLQRDQKNEAIIKKRLHDHFTKHARLLRAEMSDIRNKSIIAAFLGLLMMLAATYIGSIEQSGFMHKFLFVVLEPAGWFTTWFALDKIFYASEKKKPQFLFYKKMSKSEIAFSSY